MSTRYAVYFAPGDDHPLWRAGCAWLGRDPRAGQPAGAAPAFARDPWRYGFHATLKAPIRLAPPHGEAAFLDAVRALAREHRRFGMPPLQVAELSGFVALLPARLLAADHPLWALANACVQQLDAFRAPPTEAELARRRSQPLDAAQRDLLARWGYAHVLTQWRFHMTLSDTLAQDSQREAVVAQARSHFAAALDRALPCDALCVFTEPAPGEPFVLAHRFELQA
ncbi:DUF1045 domain-containing protein [Pseudothauera rhizosphaerae]|uniref:DUF1045 domain-containing protein n=1 Tax=Pseudothauera rhizosphaerae TaxID=2565932 RepID=A0A4S4ALR6_9RHOO|nr:DUF1045 domain-containing protein [Pseudothauera rhizosphaerae]THF59240.1 DUF1045 domain-containing protein [Pseudothauera rhizosphaerae]